MAKQHSKLKNTGLLFELLVRQIASDILSKKDSSANEIIKEYFSGKKELAKELQLYQTLIKDRFDKEYQAEQFIDKVISARVKLDNKKLKSEKYNLVKKINENYNINEFFKARVQNYRVHASIYQLFEDAIGNNVKPAAVITSRSTLVEHITNRKVPTEQVHTKIVQEYEKLDKDLRLLTYKSLVERFNDRYSVLDEKQKELLRQYINNVTNTTKLKEYIDSEIPNIKNELISAIKKVNNEVVRIKLKEINNQIENYMSGAIVEDKHILMLMRYYELLKELKNLEIVE